MRRIILNGDEVRQVLETGRVVVRRVAPITDIRFDERDSGFLSWSVIFSKPMTPRKILSTHGGTYIGEEQARHYIGSGWNPIGEPGTKVWVAEGWSMESGALYDDDPLDYHLGYKTFDVRQIPEGIDEQTCLYLYDHQPGDWASPVVMPQWASRLTLEIDSVRVERGDKWEWVWELKRVQE